jgi:hypothetical protein
VGVGIGAVQLAGAQVADGPIQPLTADEVPTLPPPADPAPTDAASTTVPSTTAATTTIVPPPTSTSPPPTATQPAPTTTEGSTPATASTTPASTTTSTVPPTTTSTAPAAQPEISVHQLIGGTVSIAASPGIVNLVSATPNDGFIVEVESGGPMEVEVEFKSTSHESKFNASWSSGTLDTRIREEADD